MTEHPNDGLVREARGIKRTPCILLLVGLGVFAFVFGPGRVVPPDEDRAPGPRREIRSMAEIEPFIDDGTLLVFDLDNTLIEPVGNLGSDQWFHFLVRKFTEVDRLDEKEAAARAMKLWNKAQWLVEVKAVEPLTPNLIRRQQDRGIKTMGLTAREPEIAGRTLELLERVGVRLGRSTVHDAERKAGGGLFKQGVLFVGEGRDKGDELVKFLREIRYAPAKVLFVDDRLDHVVNVEKACRRAGIDYLVFRYGATDAKVEQFNRDTEDPQLFASGVLSEKAAEAVKRAGKE
jgi:phosphoserine phosphatase